jgi:hypothetical protein
LTITVEAMRPKLLTLEHARVVLDDTEPVKAHPFTVGDAVKFRAESGWNHGIKAKTGTEPVAVFATLGRGRFAQEFALTKDCLQEACLLFGFPRAYTDSCPAELLVPAMNHWYREGLLGQPRKKTDFQFLAKDNVATAFTRQSLIPFSNIALIDEAVDAITGRYGNVEILVDYKFHHTLRQTAIRLIIPDATKLMRDTGTPDDTWSLGVQIRNSLAGVTQTSIEGYLFRWVCTNGQIDTQASSGAWTRRPTATEDEVYAWARHAVDEALGGLEHSLDAVQALTGLHIDGSLSDTLRDVFEHYRIPINQRTKIINLLAEYDGEVTMYVIMNAITQVANEQGLEATTVDNLMRVGGDMPYSADKRCGACRRMLHEH